MFSTRRRAFRAPSLFAILILSLPIRADSDIEAWGRQCAAILAPNTLRVQYGQDSASAFRDYLCGSYSTTHDVSGGVSVLDVFDANGTEKTVSRQDFCHDTTLTVSVHTMYQSWESTVPDSARTGFTQCMANFPEQTGVPPSLLVKKNEQPGAVLITTSWNRNICRSATDVRKLGNKW